MNFDLIQTYLAQKINIDESDSTNSANLKRWINLAYIDFCSRYNWSWLMKRQQFKTIPVYNTGTVTATQDSRTVTGSGTAWTSAMVGRYISIAGTDRWYRIIAVGSGTSLTIEIPYIDIGGSSKTYEIWARFYEVNTDVRAILSMFMDKWAKRIERFPEVEGVSRSFDKRYNGIPSFYLEEDESKATTTYSTGTVTGTINTRTLTGTSTVWLDNAKPGDLVTISTDIYNILTVDSDTQLTLCQNIDTTVSGASYTITRRDIKRIQFNFDPVSPGELITYRYTKDVYLMKNDNDVPEIPEKYVNVLLLGAEWISKQWLDDAIAGQAKSLYEIEVNKIILNEINAGDTPTHYYLG